MVGFIYKYENKINHKVYIGQTTDLVNRKASHRYKSTFTKSKFYNAVRKYGWDNFDFDVIAQVEEDTLEKVTEVLDELEINFIKKYNSFNKGYNSTSGGHSYRGKEVSEDFREYCKNRTYSDETRHKMSESRKRVKVSDETRKKLSAAAKRNNFAAYRELTTEKRIAGIKMALSKPVLQIDKDGTIVNEFSSLNDAVMFILTHLALEKTFSGIQHGVHRHCVGEIKKKYYYGFEWKFKSIV